MPEFTESIAGGAPGRVQFKVLDANNVPRLITIDELDDESVAALAKRLATATARKGGRAR